MSNCETVRLGDVCTVMTGTTPKSNVIEYWDGEHNWVTPAELSNESDVIFETERKITDAAIKASSLRAFPAGTVLLSSRAPIGKVAIAGTEMYCNQGFKNFVCSEKIFNRFLFRWLKGQTEFLNSLGRGATFKEISKTIVEDIRIPLPPLPEQRKIAAVLDKICGLIADRKLQLEQLDLMVKARFVEMFGTGQYPLVRLEDICGFITKGTTPPTNKIVSTLTKESIPYIKVYNLSDSGEMLFNENPQYIDVETHNNLLARSKVLPNDVLMNIVGLPLGKFALVPDDFNEWNINQAIAIFRSLERTLPIYLMYAMMQPNVLQPFLERAVGIRQINLSLKQCRELEIPLPPLNLQHRFTDFVHKTGKLKHETQQSLTQLELQYNALMQQYFGN